MKAVQYFEHSTDISKVALMSVEKPLLVHPGSALIKIYAASINPADTLIWATGMMPTPLPLIPGYDFSGIIEDIIQGEDGTFSVGDEVFGCHSGKTSQTDEFGGTCGAFAEWVVVPIHNLYRKPDNVTHEQAASTVMVSTTVLMAFKIGQVNAQSRVFVQGGSTCIGSLVIQMAKAKGAFVVTTASTRVLSYVSQFNPDHIIDYTKQNWWEINNTGHGDFDFILICGKEEGAFEHAKGRGIGGIYVAVADFAAGVDSTAHQPRFSHAAFLTFAGALPTREEHEAFTRQIGDGSLKLQIEDIYPFTPEGVTAMWIKSMQGKSLGKNVLKIV